MSFRDLRRSIVASNGRFVAIESVAAETLHNLGIAIARHERVADSMLANALASEDSDALVRVAEQLAAPVRIPGAAGSQTAIVSFRGMVTQKIEFQPYAVGVEQFARTMRDLGADPAVKQIVIVFNSPGGTVPGVPEAADAVYAAAQSKKVIAYVEDLCASAALWVASQATEIVCLPSGTGVGSIGVRMMHVDCSRAMDAGGMTITHIHSGEYKTEGNMFEPLSDEAKARFQMESDTIYSDFLGAVARGRNVKPSVARTDFGKGRVLLPAEAKRVGLIDRLGTFDSVLSKLGATVVSAARGAEANETAPTAEAEAPQSETSDALAASPGETSDAPETVAADEPVKADAQIDDASDCASVENNESVKLAAIAAANEHRRRLLDLA